MLYRLRYGANYWYFQQRTRAILRSAPLPCDPDAACEIHTMLRGADLGLYLLAIKSLLQHTGPLSVIIYSDGSLEGEPERIVKQHLPGCLVVTKRAADERAASILGDDSFLRHWRGVDAAYQRLVDTALWSVAGKKRIIMDSDVLTLRRPDELLEWIASGDTPFLLGQGPPPESEARLFEEPTDVPQPDQRHVQQIFMSRLKPLSAKMNLPARFLHGTGAGFYGCYQNELPLEQVERVLRAALDLRIPMQQWGGDQCVVIYLMTAAGARRLNPDFYFNFVPTYTERCATAAIVHFFGTHRFHKHLYTELGRRVALGLAHA